MSKEQLTTIRLSGQLGKKFGKVHKFYVSSAAEAVRALCSQIDGFAGYLKDEKRQTYYRVFVADSQIDPENELHLLSGTREIRISPVIQGAKRGGIFQAVLGAALIAVSFFIPPAAMVLGASLKTMVFSMGVSLALGGIAQMLSPQPKLNIQESPQNEPNTSIGVVNTASQGRPVSLIYGEVMAGSAIISASVVNEAG